MREIAVPWKESFDVVALGVVIYVVYSGSCEHFATHLRGADHSFSVKLLADTVAHLC